MPPEAIHVLANWNGTSPNRPLVTSHGRPRPTPNELRSASPWGFYHVVRKDDQAIGSLEAARALRPDNAAILSYLGEALKLKGDRARRQRHLPGSHPA